MAGRQPLRAESHGEIRHRIEADEPVTAHARVRGPPRHVPREEVVDDRRPKVVLEVHRQVRDAHRVGQRARPDDRLRRAAAARTVGSPVGPQLHGHRNHLGAPLALEPRGDRAVDSAAHRHEDAAGHRSAPDRPFPGRDQRCQRAVQRVGCELGGVATLGRESAERLGDVLGPQPRGVEDRAALDELGERRAGRARGRATLGVEARRRDAPALESDRDPDQVPARRASRGAAVRALRGRGATRRVTQVVVEGVRSQFVEDRERRKGPNLPASRSA